MKNKSVLFSIALVLFASGVILPLALKQLPDVIRIMLALSDLGAATVVVIFALRLPPAP